MKATIFCLSAEARPSKSMLTPSPPPATTRATMSLTSSVRCCGVARTALMPSVEKRVKHSTTCTPWLCASAMTASDLLVAQPWSLPMIPLLPTSAENHARWVSVCQGITVPDSVQ